MLDDLQYHCETLASEYLTKENVIENFKKAKVRNTFIWFWDVVIIILSLWIKIKNHLRAYGIHN